MSRFILSLAAFLTFQFCGAAQARIPSWMVKIEKTLPTGGKITGTGYVVELNGKLYVRTAAHLTLGNLQQVQLTDYQNRPVSMLSNESKVNNDLDDQMIRINSAIAPLAVYSPQVSRFLVVRSAFTEVARHSKRVNLEASVFHPTESYGPDVMVSPPWADRKEFRVRRREDNTRLQGLGAASIEANADKARWAQQEGMLLADFKIVPGESGSPVVGWSTISLDKFDMNFAYRVDLALTAGGFVDALGKPIDAVVDRRIETVVYIKGHVLSYHRTFQLSQFLSATAFAELNKAVLSNAPQSTTTQWQYHRRGSYRVFNNGKMEVSEVISTSKNSGNGTGVDGGNGTGVDGGNGTGVDGGNGTGVDGGNSGGEGWRRSGLLVDGRVVMSFRLKDVPRIQLQGFEKLKDLFDQDFGSDDLKKLFQKRAFIAASWQNLVFLERLQKQNSTPIYEVIYSDGNWASYFDGRFQGHELSIPPAYSSCVISRSELSRGILTLKIRLGVLKSDEEVFVREVLSDVSALAEVNSRSFGRISIDLSGLWGLDISFMGPVYDYEKSLTPFISIRARNFIPVRYRCVLGN